MKVDSSLTTKKDKIDPSMYLTRKYLRTQSEKQEQAVQQMFLKNYSQLQKSFNHQHFSLHRKNYKRLHMLTNYKQSET
jgi:hypothetical protein